MNRFVYTAFALLLSVAACAKPSPEKPKYLWMCLDANFERLSHKDSISFYLDKARETGFNGVVVDVRGVDGYVAYKSCVFPRVRFEGDFYNEDYLSYFISQIRKRGMRVYVSASIFPEGSPIKKKGPVYDDPALKELTCVEYTADGMKKIEDDNKKVAAFMNPLLPQARHRAETLLRELFSNYDIDAFCLDYCRFPDASSDFSESSRLAFEEFLGHPVADFPGDIFTFDDVGNRVPGVHYKEWWQFRSTIIRDFVSEVRTLRDELRPEMKLHYWAASWLHGIYTQGQNWSSPQSRFYEQYEDDWASDDYFKTAFADQIDVFITGTYLEKVWGKDDPESIEFGINRTLRDVQGACEVHGSLYAQNRNEFEDAVYLSLSRTSGLMIFDIVQVIRYNLWKEIKAGIDRAEKESR